MNPKAHLLKMLKTLAVAAQIAHANSLTSAKSER